MKKTVFTAIKRILGVLYPYPTIAPLKKVPSPGCECLIYAKITGIVCTTEEFEINWRHGACFDGNSVVLRCYSLRMYNNFFISVN